MKNKVLSWLINCLSGTFFSFGVINIIYMFISSDEGIIYDKKFVMFIFVVLLIGWACSFIYHFNSKLIVTALLHSIVWFMLACICYMSIFEMTIEFESLLSCMVGYGLIYVLGLLIVRFLGRRINTPFRHFNEFVAKFTQIITK